MKITEIETTENPLINELFELNVELDDQNKEYLATFHKKETALLLCADARVIPRAFHNDVITYKNAGNILDPDAPFPENVRTVIVVGHEKEKAINKGCCAVETATSVYNHQEIAEGLRKESPNLYKVSNL